MRKKSIFISFLLFVLLFLIGCASQKQYYWGDYSNTLYAYRKNANDENLLKHKATLEKIIQESADRNLRVPPGVYAELGYIYLRQNNKDTAIKYFDLEAKTYPESKLFMERLTQSAIAKTGGQNTVEPAAKTGEDAEAAGKISRKAEKTDVKTEKSTIETKPNKN
jgi:hypothetical protein